MPSSFKEIFLFVTGTTPQVVTETIYALSQKRPPIYPDEIYIITTSKGKEVIKESLLSKGIINRLKEEAKIPKLTIKEDSFIILKDHKGREMKDILNEKDNEAAGDQITALVRKLTTDHSTRLHCSIAGGRKTMGFYLGAALQLFGRPQDRLYHVIVTPEFESNPQFFYKPAQNRTIEIKAQDGSTKAILNTKDAKIYLADLPFIRLRDKFSLHGKGFRELVKEGQREIDIAAIQPGIEIDLEERKVTIGNSTMTMTPVQLIVFTAFLKLKSNSCQHPQMVYCLDCMDCFQTLQYFIQVPVIEEMAKDYKRIYRGNPDKDVELIAKWKGKVGIEVFRQNISKINRVIKENLGLKTLLPYYIISNVRHWGSTRYGIRVEKGKIEIK